MSIQGGHFQRTPVGHPVALAAQQQQRGRPHRQFVGSGSAGGGDTQRTARVAPHRANRARHPLAQAAAPRANMLRSARLGKLAGAAAVGGAGAAMLFSPAAQCEAEQRKGKGPLQRRASVSDSINVVRADMSLAGAKPLYG